MDNKIIAILGPTASGKTALSIELAKKIGGEIVSCDSMQIYKGMDIGTAKPTLSEREGIPHYMIDIIEPDEKYNVVNYKKDAEEKIDDILKRGKTPLLVGGTGLYMDSVLNNTAFSENSEQSEKRKELEELLIEKGKDYLHSLLYKIDPVAAEKIHPNNTRRVIRAIEIFETTGYTPTQSNQNSIREKKYDSLVIGISAERETLYKRINERVDKMMAEGLLGEVEELLNKGMKAEYTSMQAIGYKEIFEYFKGECSLCDAVEKIKQESRRYAKRQMTWFKRNKAINWIILQEDYNFNKIYEQGFTLIKKFGIM